MTKEKIENFGLRLEVGKTYVDRQGLPHKVTAELANGRFDTQCYWGTGEVLPNGQNDPHKMHRRDLIAEVGPYAKANPEAKYYSEDSNRYSSKKIAIYGDENFFVCGPCRIELEVVNNKLRFAIFRWNTEGPEGDWEWTLAATVGTQIIGPLCAEVKIRALAVAMDIATPSITRKGELSARARNSLRGLWQSEVEARHKRAKESYVYQGQAPVYGLHMVA